DSFRTIELFISFLDDKFHEPWTLDSMAEHCGLGITRFVHYFKLATNMTPMQYLNFIRLKAAANILVTDHHAKISKVCYDHGFSSGQYFSTAFRKQFGCSPADYRIGNVQTHRISQNLV